MRRILTFAIVTLAALAGGLVVAQAAKPNFAGQWTLVPDPSGQEQMGMMAGDMTIAQDDKTITVTRSIPQMGDMKSVYKLDGSDSPNTFSFNGNDTTMTSKATWDGNKLSIKTSFDMGGQSAQTTMVLSLDATGNLNVDMTRPDFQGGGADITTKAVYKKKS